MPEKFPLNQVISPQLISTNMTATTKDEALKELVELLYVNGNISSKELFLKDVYLREQEGATGIGQGVAIPHGKSTAVTKTSVAVGLTKELIEWESIDDQGVNIIILLAVQESDANTTHLLMLQQIATMLANDDFIARLQNVKNAEEFIHLIETFQNNQS